MTLKEKFEDIEHLGLCKDEYSLPVWSTKVLDEQTNECEKIADEFAIGFGKWILRNFNNYGPNDEKELLEIYKKEKGL